MGDIMRPVPFGELINRISGEYRNQNSIFGLSKDQFFKDDRKKSIDVFSQSCTTPVGPAAGPHSQLAQNIITSYLAGARFVEVKTVQIMDTLEIPKPCIDARDEGYNTEWSTEYTLEKAWDEYAKAWIICYLIEALMNKGEVTEPTFIFNMSVGYDLAGIKTPKMQKYIDSMMDASLNPKFNEYLEELDALLKEKDLFAGSDWAGMEDKMADLPSKISKNIVKGVTLSTMHGCPPKEIEAICTYMLTEKKIDTFVKLNPTLLGYDKVREILDGLGYDYLHLSRTSFEKDLQYTDAVAMLHRLVDVAKENGRQFGVKLTNTLGSVNDQGFLPGDEMYASGRALMPISVNVAAKLSREFDGTLPVSYSGGANALTISDIFETGIRPITVATDMLHPGGYSRMAQMATILSKSKYWDMDKIDVEKLNKLADTCLSSKYLDKAFRGTDKVAVDEKLPMFDCYIAPCQEACPIHQDIPDYVELMAEGKYAEALTVIYMKNPLPYITGLICDHQCQTCCSRKDYEGSVQIREIKKLAVENGFKGFKDMWVTSEKSDFKVAVIGAGPAGLSAAFFLARSGFQVQIFEKEETAGGVVRNVIPEFRIPEEAINSDVEFIKANGVDIKFGATKEETKVEALKKAGYDYIFFAIGTEKDNPYSLKGGDDIVIEALPFLRSFRLGSDGVKLGKHVVILGAGNVAMDAARAAKRADGVEDVTIVYRRTVKEMPADMEEYEYTLEDGIKYLFLTNPSEYNDGVLTLNKMELGEPDESGRRRPVATDETFTMPCDSIITAIASHVDTDMTNYYGLPCDERGRVVYDKDTLESPLEGVYLVGDMTTGPSVVVKCIASARKGVEALLDTILGKEDSSEESCGCGDPDCECEHDHDHDEESCGCGCGDDDDDDVDMEAVIAEENRYYKELRDKKGKITEQVSADAKNFLETEGLRCNECSYLCNKCVEVCPNRANITVDVRNTGIFTDPFQIVHIDAYCNECGNCETFCPYIGAPYKDKFTLFSRRDDFENSTNSGFLAEGQDITIRLDGKLYQCQFNGEGLLEGDEGVSDEVAAIIEEIYLSYSYLLGEVED
jgi:putative selenate reductase